MKLEVKREDFLRVFSLAATVAPSRSPKAILQNVKIHASQGQLTITATDTEVGIRVVLNDVEVNQEGSVLLPVGRLGSVLRESSDETLKIEAKQDKTIIRGRNSRYELQGPAADEFPQVNEFGDTENCFQMPAGTLRRLIHRTIFATDTESSRYALGGVMLEINDHTATMVGTDGRRLAKMEGTIGRLGQPRSPSTMTIIPAKSAHLIERMLGDDDAIVKILLGENEIQIKEGNTVFSSRLVEGRFPKWRDVIPSNQNTIAIELLVGPMYAALRQASIVTSDESRGIDFHFEGGELVLKSSTSEVGSSEVKLPVTYDGPPIIISLDNRYMADFFRALSAEMTFTLQVENSETAAYCHMTDGYGYVVMPLARDHAA